MINALVISRCTAEIPLNGWVATGKLTAAGWGLSARRAGRHRLCKGPGSHPK